MEKVYSSKTYFINDFKEWNDRDELILSPYFQRRTVWSVKAKSYLIDTIIRQLPIPKIFMRHKLSGKAYKSVREIVDGQQRLGTVLSFLEDGFTLLKSHNSEYGGKYFSDLPEKVKKDILNYEIATDVLSGSKDEVIIDIFARLNTYNIPLNNQELLNASFFGDFKKISFNLAQEFYKFWIENNIFSNSRVMRMAEVQLTSELVILMIAGIQSTKVIESFYKEYDDQLKNKRLIMKRFRECMDLIGRIYGNELKNSSFHSATLFYSLFSVIYHFKFGLEESKFERIKITVANLPKLKNSLDYIEEIIRSDDVLKKNQKFIDAVGKHTTDFDNRLYRTEFMIKNILDKLK
jgi:mRNA-degrading endonuclease YafQ of YafQ-DinJ toxin-antitoxin module